MGNIGIIILAAGTSRRLGKPKQLIPYLGKPLIQNITEVAINSSYQPIIVVLGAYKDIIEPHLNHFNINLAFNEKWSQGISTSIKCGLNYIQKLESNLDGIILMLCDQPFVSSHLINQLVVKYRQENPLIVACEYSDIIGVPALFDKSLFSELFNLTGDIGAKKLILRYHKDVLKIPFAKGEIDLDTLDDIENFNNKLVL